MAADVSRVVAEVKKALAANDLTTLFESVLVWDDGLNTSPVNVGTASARYVASKSRVPVWLITAETEAEVDALDKRLRKESFERLLVWQRPQGRTWLFPEKTSAGIRRSKTTESNLEAIAQRLAELRFEPGGPAPTVLDVKERLQRTFSVEKVTEKFYKEFKDIHDRLGGRRSEKRPAPLLRGLPDINASRWYASVLLNRLMFLYFLQRKGFLDNDMDYLQNRMLEVQKLYGKGKFYTFYSSFLIPLFQSAIGSPRWESLSPEMKKLVGRVPYLNGGVFAQHPLEKEHTIELDDDIFTDIFAIFRRYRWHLDESEHAEDQSLPQINPDILGHIFERYVNEGDQDTGAFYTPSDVTRWMTTRTVGSTVLQRLIELGVDLGALIAKDPERYLPSEHFVGRADADEWLGEYPKLGSKEAAEWSKPVPTGRGLPTETVWEVRDRLKYAAQMTKELGTGKFGTPAELFRFNLNNPVLISDAMRTLTPEKLQKYWDQLFSITIVDPTCGSGAFLLAALAFLEELTLDALTRADELASDSKKNAPAFAKEHATKNLGQRRLTIRTNFIINCLYGADLSGEAVEIARLRLYLALVATTSVYEDLRPLPDLEFNLAEGNLLVGVNSEAEMEQLIGSALWAQGEIGEVRKHLAEVSKAISAFNAAQQTNDHVKQEELKLIAMQRAIGLKEQLNIALHKAMAPDSLYPQWLKSHEPLHYLAQFPSVMLGGGFDVVIGNPPYIAKGKITTYQYSGMAAANCPDIYAPCTVRAAGLTHHAGWLSFVLPLNSSFSDGFIPLRQFIEQRFGTIATASFGKRPDALFRGVQVRNTILTGLPSKTSSRITTGQTHWTPAFRPALMSTIRFTPVASRSEQWERYEGNVISEFVTRAEQMWAPIVQSDSEKTTIFYKPVGTYWLPVSPLPFRSLDKLLRAAKTTSKIGVLRFSSDADRAIALALLSSRMGWLLWQAVGDDFNVTRGILLEWRMQIDENSDLGRSLQEIGKAIEHEMMTNNDARVWNWQSGMWLENFDNRKITAVTDLAILALLESTGLAAREDEFEAAYWRCMKATRESAGVVYGELPPKVSAKN
jgi:hypothetical protein